jgi:hypothetical protein
MRRHPGPGEYDVAPTWECSSTVFARYEQRPVDSLLIHSMTIPGPVHIYTYIHPARRHHHMRQRMLARQKTALQTHSSKRALTHMHTWRQCCAPSACRVFDWRASVNVLGKWREVGMWILFPLPSHAHDVFRSAGHLFFFGGTW